MRHRVNVLGAVCVVDANGSERRIPGRRQQCLLLALVAAGPNGLSSSEIADIVWFGSGVVPAESTIRSNVSRLRKALEGVASLTWASDRCRLHAENSDVDAWDFVELAEAGDIEAALDCYHPEPYELLESPWAAAPREHLRSIHQSILIEHFSLRAGRHDERIVPDLFLAVELYPLAEQLWVRLALQLHSAGRTGEALRAIDRLRSEVLAELGLVPGPEISRVERDIVRQQRVATRQIPGELTSFVGRSSDLKLLNELIRTRRVVTVLGPGGIGKTRLAREAARQLADNGCVVHYVPLEGVIRSDRIVDSILATLGAVPGSDPIDSLASLLDERESVLVLDNAEHLLNEVSRLVRTLASSCSRLRVVVTSRAALGLIEEHRLSLAPLGSDDAVALFVDRARAFRPRFATDDTALEEIQRVCEVVDRLPLAIELAASRLRTGSLNELTQEVTHGRRPFPAANDEATIGGRGSVDSAVRWSLSMVDPDDAALLGELCVFHGQFTLQDAEAVVSRPDAAAGSIQRLVDASLIQLVDTVPGTVACRLLATTRSEARTHAGDLREVEERKESWAIHLCSQLEDVSLSDAAELARRIDERWADIRSVVDASLEQGTSSVAQTILSSVRSVAFGRPRREAIDWILTLAGRLKPEDLQVFADTNFGAVNSIGRPDQVSAFAKILDERGTGTFHRLDYREQRLAALQTELPTLTGRRRLWALNGLAGLHTVSGRQSIAGPLALEAVGLARELGGLTAFVASVEQVLYAAGVLESAVVEPLYREALELCEDANLVASSYFLRSMYFGGRVLTWTPMQVIQAFAETAPIALRADVLGGSLQSQVHAVSWNVAALGEHDEAAVLFGALEVHRTHAPPEGERLVAQWRQASSDHLGSERFDELVREGNRLGERETAERALAICVALTA